MGRLLVTSLLLLASCTRSSQIESASNRSSFQELSAAEKGKQLISAKGCVSCHSVDGSRLVGPTYRGIFGNEVTLQDGSKVKVDEAYIKESILFPNAKLVQGYPPSMPSYQGQVSDVEIAYLVEYIKSLK